MGASASSMKAAEQPAAESLLTAFKTLSAADASDHLLKNPLLSDALAFPHNQLVITLLLLVLLGAMFLRGFREVIGLAVVLVGAYLVLNAVIIGSHLLTVRRRLIP